MRVEGKKILTRRKRGNAIGKTSRDPEKDSCSWREWGGEFQQKEREGETIKI